MSSLPSAIASNRPLRPVSEGGQPQGFTNTSRKGSLLTTSDWKTDVTAELIYERVDSDKPFVGMTNFKGNYITEDDVKIAKNYLSEKELQRLNLMVSQFLDFAELQALDEIPMKMQDWVAALDNQIVSSQRKILEGKGKISHEEAMEKAAHEYNLFRKKELANLKSDFDLFLEETKKLSK